MFTVRESELIRMNEIILKINADFDEKTLRTSFLSEMRSLIQCDQAAFYLSEKNTYHLSITDPVSLNIGKYYLDEYNRYYYKIDEVFPHICNISPIVYRYTDILNGKEKMTSEAYNDFFKPMGACYSQGMNLIWNEQFLGIVVFYRANGRNDFTGRELFILRQFQNHLSHKLSKLHFHDGNDTPCYVNIKACYQRYRLSEREMEIVNLILSGYQNQEISEKLYIELSTVKTHMKNIFYKLNISNRTQILSLLLQNQMRR